MTSKDPLEFLRQTSQRHSEQQLELASNVLEAFNAMHDAERVLYQARRRYIESFKRAKAAGWKAQELGTPVFRRRKFPCSRGRLDYRHLMLPSADSAEAANSASTTN
ncbi:hypothetical protein [Pseudarthrobacter oxydans]|uniref:hypothetical protein n=1 Tax=Pseudarthrobacter oxydans TaxID=1671 RepID=UPI0037F1A924